MFAAHADCHRGCVAQAAMKQPPKQPAAPPRLAVVYVEDLERAASELELRSTDSGVNVLLIEPVDAGSFAGAVREDGIAFAAATPVAADLLMSPGRGPQEAEELIDWMTRNEDAWRG